jgi:hypothetical protein
MRRNMGRLEIVPEAAGNWQAVATGIERLGPIDQGAFGHPHQRRLGLRLAAKCWALLTRGEHSVYAIAVELSATGVVLELVGPEHGDPFRPEQRFRLDLFVPAASSPVRTVVRPVRAVGEGEAFELVGIAATDRLTLAEHLDQLMKDPARRSARELTRRRSS